MTKKNVVLFLIIFLFSFIPLSAADVVIKYIGKVQVKQGTSAKWRKVKIKEILKPGDMIQTKANSHVTLSILENNGIITLGPNSKLLITRQIIKEKKTPSFLLFLGHLKGKIQKKQPRQIDFATPTAVVGIRGTVFDIAVADEGTAKVGVARGEVVVAGENQDVTLDANESSVIPFGGNPQDKIAYSTNEDLSLWQTEIKKQISGHEMQILSRVESILENNYHKIDKLNAENDENLKKLNELKKEKADLVSQNAQKSDIAEKDAEILKIIAKRSRLIVASYNLDYRNQAVFEIASRIYKKNKSDSQIKTKYKQIQLKYNFYHAKFVKTPQKKGCLHF